MSSIAVIELIVAIALLGVILLLALAEAAINGTSQIRIEALAEEHPRPVARLQQLLEAPEAILNPLRLVILVAQVAHVTLAVVVAESVSDTPVLTVVTVVAVIAALFVVDVVARTLGVMHSDRLAVALVGPISRIVMVVPIKWVARGLIGIGNIIVPGRGLSRGPFAHPEELIALADAAVEDAVLEQDERDLIESVIEFGDTVVREVMVPRTDMTTVERDASVAEGLEQSSAAGYSRLPVIGENIDDVLGLIYVKDMIRAELDGDDSLRISSLVRDATFVPETKPVARLLREMQEESFHMAVVVDEYGGVAGLVTLEDLIEELVGEIVDEYDVEEPLLERQPDGTLRVDGRILISELNDIAGLELPEGDFDTVAGLVFDRFGRVPLEGESCDCDGYTLRVERVQARRITRVHVVGSPAGARRVETEEQAS